MNASAPTGEVWDHAPMRLLADVSPVSYDAEGDHGAHDVDIEAWNPHGGFG
jgi:hypothetical protein